MPTQTLIQRCRATRYPVRVPLGARDLPQLPPAAHPLRTPVR